MHREAWECLEEMVSFLLGSDGCDDGVASFEKKFEGVDSDEARSSGEQDCRVGGHR